MHSDRAYSVHLTATLVAFVLIIATSSFSSHPALAHEEGIPDIHLVLATHPARTLSIDVSGLFHTVVEDFFLEDDGSVYVQTGDIPAMWLRDSSAQTLPYVRFASATPQLEPLIRAVIERNAKNVITDPYANAFTAGYRIWEEKWEVDSPAYPVTLAYAYWNATHDRAMFTQRLHWALSHVVSAYECEQHHSRCSLYSSRLLINRGQGAYYAQTGMIWGAFRPSDDRVRYPFNVPQQMMASVALDELAELVFDGYGDRGLAASARLLAAQVRDGIDRYGVHYDFRHGWIWAYEVDGYGNALFIDDANVPNLISATAVGYTWPEDPIYRATRGFSLSTDNPYYYRGAYAAGLGSPHTPTGWVWPLGMMIRALTAPNWDNVAQTLAQLRASGGTEAMHHESLDPNRPWRFTRPEFDWASAVYAELVFRSVAGLAPVDRAAPWYATRLQTPQLPDVVSRWENAGTIISACQKIFGTL